MKTELQWMGKAIFIFITDLFLKTVILSPLIVTCRIFLNITDLLIALGVVGLTAIDYGLSLKRERDMRDMQDILDSEAVKQIGIPTFLVVGILSSYISFSIAVIFGSFIYGITQLGLLFTLFWSNFEYWIIIKKWFLSPTALISFLFLNILNYLRPQHHILSPDILSNVPNANVLRMILRSKNKKYL